MNTHKNARLTFARRIELVTDIVDRKLTSCAAAAAQGVTAATARKWLGRYLAGGHTALADRSSRPHRSPRSMPPATAVAIVELRRRRLTQARIAACLGVSASSVSRVLARAGLSRLGDLDPVEPVQRYEHAAPGDLLHIDTKKLGRIERPSHRVTGNRRDSVEGAGWEFLFVAIDDHARIGFTDMYPDERTASAVQFLRNAHVYFAGLGVRLKAVLTDNGGAFHSHAFRRACVELGLKQRFTRAYRPQTNGKVERFHKTLMDEWAYVRLYTSNHQRADALAAFLYRYNHERHHRSLDGETPITVLVNNVRGKHN